MDELDDIIFSHSMRIIMGALMDSVMEHFHITKQKLTELIVGFISAKLKVYIGGNKL